MCVKFMFVYTFMCDLLLSEIDEFPSSFVHCQGHSFPLEQRQSLSVKLDTQNRS